MTRDAFMKELAYLLQDIQDEDKEDAIQYYMDYFDDAGPGQEDDIIKELGSPERIAAIIRTDIAGHLEEGGEFTESGYQDERFRDPNYQVARRYDLPEGGDGDWNSGGTGGSHEAGGTDGSRDNAGAGGPHGADGKDGARDKDGQRGHSSQPRTNLVLKIILWGILIIAGGPILAGLGGGALGIAGGLAGVLIAVLITLGVLTAAMLIGGAAMIPYGIVHMSVHPLNGFFVSGTGLIILGLGVLLLALAVLFYGRFLPFLIRGIVDALNRLLHRGRYRS